MATTKHTRGGARKGAGAPSKGNVPYHRRVPPELVALLDEYLEKLKANR